MARYIRSTTTTTSLIEGVPSNLDTLQELAGIVNTGAILDADLEGLNLILKRNDGNEIVIDLTPIATGEVTASSIVSVDLSGTILTITTSGDNDYTIDLSTIDQSVPVVSLTSRISSEEILRVSGDDSLTESASGVYDSLNVRFDGLTDYNDSSLVSRVTEVEGNLTESISSVSVSINQQIDGLSIPEEYNESSLNSRVSTVESSHHLSTISLESRIDNIGGSTYNDASINNRVYSLGEAIPSDVSDLTDVGSLLVHPSYDDNSLNTRVSTLEGTFTNYDDSSLDSRVSNLESTNNVVEGSLESRVSSLEGNIPLPFDHSSVVAGLSGLESTVNGISIPTEFDSTSLTSRVSSLETTVENISIPSSYDDTLIEGRVSTNETSLTSINTRLSNIGGSTYDDTSINGRVSIEGVGRVSGDTSLTSRVSNLESTVNEIPIPTDFNDGSLTTRVSNLEVIHDLDEQSINNSISTNESSVASLDTRVGNINTNELTGLTLDGSLLTVVGDDTSYSVDVTGFNTDVEYSSGMSTMSGMINDLQGLLSVQTSTIVSLEDKVETFHSIQSTTTTTTAAPTTTTTTTTPTITTTTTLGNSGTDSYLMYADSGAAANQILYNGNNNTFYPFVSQGAPTTFDAFVTNRLNTSDRITVFTHDVCVDKDTVIFNLNFQGDSPSSNEVQAFYLHPSAQGTITQIIDNSTNLVYTVTPTNGQSILIGGANYTVYKWLQGQPNGTTFALRVNNCL